MKKGQIVRISRQLPRDCPFQSYADLHSHWSSLVGLTHTHTTHTHTHTHTLLCSVSPDLSLCVAVFQYGYRLPQIPEQDVVYCSVYFKLVGQRLFTYPPPSVLHGEMNQYII